VLDHTSTLEIEEPLLQRDSAWWLAWRALLVDQRAYTTVVHSLSPFKKGFFALLAILAIVLVARLVGALLGYLTSPRLDSLQALIENFITGLPWYADQAQQTRAFVTQFAQSYGLSWEGVRAALGVPTPTNVSVNTGSIVLSTLLNWLAYGTLAHWAARWFGGTGTWKQTLGAMALSYAPLLLLVVETIPGAVVPVSLLFLAMLVSKYLALKSAQGLTPGYTLASVLMPYAVVLVILLALTLFGAAFGLEQVPFMNQGMQIFQLFSGGGAR
jgi:hypothetical protein